MRPPEPLPATTWATVARWARWVWWVPCVAVGAGFVTGDGQPAYGWRLAFFLATGLTLFVDGRRREAGERERGEPRAG